MIVLVAKYKKLRTISFGLALQIAIQNLLSIIIPSSGLVSTIANQWILGEHMCALVGTILQISIAVRTLILFVFIIDRFFSVFCPFAYPRFQTKTVVVLSIGSWLIACVFDTLGVILDCYSFKSAAVRVSYM